MPVNGRNFEYFGEDPYLASVIAANWVKQCSAQGVVPTIKHFAANNQETNRSSVDAEVDERTMQEIYLPAFRKAALEGGNVAVMCSYNRLNGHYASNNDWLLNRTLKQQWGFKGLVMSDWGASHSVTDLAMGLTWKCPEATTSPQRTLPPHWRPARSSHRTSTGPCIASCAPPRLKAGSMPAGSRRMPLCRWIPANRPASHWMLRGHPSCC